MFIYKITNNINGRIYVGQTVQTVERRFKRHVEKFSGNSSYKSILFLAFEKHGLNNFVVETIDTANTIDELNEKEIFWIQYLNTLTPNGYNLTTGGGNGGHLSDETKKKISLSNLGKKASPETIVKLKKSHLGLKMSDETKQKLSITNKGKKPHVNTIRGNIKNKAKKYKVINPDGKIINVYNMAEFCRKNNLSSSKMCLVVNNERNHHKGWSLYK